jgi:hypothetical protein
MCVKEELKLCLALVYMVAAVYYMEKGNEERAVIALMAFIYYLLSAIDEL